MTSRDQSNLPTTIERIWLQITVSPRKLITIDNW